MKYLTMTGFTVRTGSDRWTLGYEGENNSRILRIKTTDDLTDFATVNLLIDTLDCGAMTVETVSNYKVLSMVLTAAMLGEAGKKTCQLLVMDSEGTVIKKTNQFHMVVGMSNDIEGTVPDSERIVIITDYIEEKVDDLLGEVGDTVNLHTEEIEEVKASIDTQIDVNSFDLKSNYNVYPNKNDTIAYTGFDLISRRKNYIEFNGSTTSSLLRFAIFNDSQTKVSSTTPSYANRPAWYNTIDNFVVGHKYYFGVKLLSGSYEWTGTTPLDNFIDVRTKDDGILYQSRNSEWICTVKPEMICFSIGKGSYQNAVFELSIIDTTDFGENDIAGKKVYGLSETVEEMEQTIELTASDVEKLQDTTLMPIRHAIKDSNTSKLKLFFFTDVHADAIAINDLLDYVQSHGEWIDEVINGGDTARYEFSSGANSNYFDSDLAPMALSVIGNHDSAVYDSNNNIDWWGKTQKEVYDRYLAPYISNWNVIQPANAATLGLNYYYKDYDTIRIIYLDAVFWDSDQLSWFEDVLSDASSDNMSVIVVAHSTDGSFTGDADCNWTWIEKPDETGYFSNMKFDGRASSAVNTFIGNGGDFICWLTGHTHFDRIGHMTNYPNQFAITMNNAGTKTSDSRGAFYSGTMVIVDKTNTLIKLIRCGCTYDSYLKPKHTLCYNYLTQELISQT